MKVVSDASPLINLARIGQLDETARHFGLRYIGLVGILSAAKRRGDLKALRPLLDRLRDVAGFRISSALYAQTLRDLDGSTVFHGMSSYMLCMCAGYARTHTQHIGILPATNCRAI